MRQYAILLVAAAVVALPFLLRRDVAATEWQPGDPVLYILSPHNEAIRSEFAWAFSEHEVSQGRPPVKIYWVNIGGTSEITRYLTSSYAAAFKSYWTSLGKAWPFRDASQLTSATPPESAAAREVWQIFRELDDPSKFSIRRDLFFGGGQYDHARMFAAGCTVPTWPEGPPRHLFYTDDGTELIPQIVSGEIWRTRSLQGNAVSAFGICYNLDRLEDLGFPKKPADEWRWSDLADPRFFGQVGLADPTKSGSAAKAFEMLIHQQMYETVRAAGFEDAEIDRIEKIHVEDLEFPEAYDRAVSAGWIAGLRLLQLIGANARYFTDSAGKVPIDVSQGDAAIGMAIDFYARFQAEHSQSPDGTARMEYVTPLGGSSVSADPISLLRGAGGHGKTLEEQRALRKTARRFVEFVLSEAGQQIWTYRPGTPGGPRKYALRRIPVRRDFFPSEDPELQAQHLKHLQYAADDLSASTIDPYQISETFTYRSRWTAGHFGIQRELIKAMCLDSGEELRAAWKAILEHGGPTQQTAALEKLHEMPTIRLTDQEGRVREIPLTWESTLQIRSQFDSLDYMQAWVEAFRNNYQQARALALKEAR